MSDTWFECTDGKSIFIKTPTIERTLYNQNFSETQIYDNKLFKFAKDTANIVSMKSFPINTKQDTHEMVIKRLWEGLWMEGWREKKPQ